MERNRLNWTTWDFDGTFTGKSITKTDIQDWIDQNRIEVQEVEKGAFQKHNLKLKKAELEKKISEIDTPEFKRIVDELYDINKALAHMTYSEVEKETLEARKECSVRRIQ